MLAVEDNDDNGGGITIALLKVDKAAREDKDITLGDGLGDKLVGSGYEADVERAIKDEDHLYDIGMNVWRDEPIECIVDAGYGDAQGVELWDLLHIGLHHQGSHAIVGGIMQE